jgi:hypothetical protein
MQVLNHLCSLGLRALQSVTRLVSGLWAESHAIDQNGWRGRSNKMH